MRLAVLGPLEVRGENEELVPLTGRKERLLLAALAVACPAVVSVDRLSELLWDGRPPPTARKALQTHVVRLRSALEPDRPRGSPGRFVARREPGYALSVDREALDALAFTDLIARGRALLSSGEPEEARAALDEALRLWRGEPYADWPDAEFVEAERQRLSGLRDHATESLLEAELALGRHTAVVPRLEQLVTEQPLHEGWWSMLSVALYRSGRQGDALETVRRARGVLADELGVDPGPRLRGVEQALLEQAPHIDVPRQREPGTGGDGAGPGPPGPLVHGCPYKGLSAFEPEDAPLFRGRDRVVASMLASLVHDPLLVVTGSSGAGKSSLVRAGLLPALAAGELVGSADRPQLVLTPGPRPVDALAELTGDDPPAVPVVLVCDQVEQLWSSGTSAAERDAFLDAVLGLLADSTVATCVLVLRGDHVGRLAEHPGMAERMVGALTVVPPLSEVELREVVAGPAAAAGLQVEPELVDVVVQDVVGRPGALPLLSTALVGTWERRHGDLLTLAGYLASGGVTGSVARTAERVYAALDPPAREAARRILVRLADQDEQGSLHRRRMPVAELDPDGRDGRTRRAVVEALVAHRLLTMDASHLEVTHEALLVAWPRLAGWLRDDAAGREVRRRLAPAAREWDRAGRPVDELLRGARLEAALGWAHDEAGDLTELEREYLDCSRRHTEEELARARARADRAAAGHRRTRRLAVGLAATLAVALVAAGSAVRFQGAAEDRADEAAAAGTVADANRLAALSATTDSIDLSLLLAAAAMRTARTPSTEDGLLNALLTHRRATGVQDLGDRLVHTTLSADGSRLFASHGAGAFYTNRWDVTSTRPPTRVAQLDAQQLAASPDGEVLLAASPWTSPVQPLPYVVAVTPDGRELVRLEGEETIGGWPLDVAYAADGTALVLLARESDAGVRGSVNRLDLRRDALVPVRDIGAPGPGGDWLEGTLGDDGGSAVVWSVPDLDRVDRLDLRTGASVRLRLTERPVASVGFFTLPDGAAQAWSDGAVTVYDGRGRPLQTLDAHDDRVLDVKVVADRGLAVTAGEAGQVELWRVGADGWRRAESLLGHEAAVPQVEVTPDGRSLFTAGQDGLVVSWDLTRQAGFGAAYPGLGDRFVSNRFDVVRRGEVVVAPTRPTSSEPRDPLTGPGPDTLQVAAVFLDPATGSELDRVVVGRTLFGALFGSSVAVSPDGRWVAVTSGRATTVIDVASREVVARVRLDPRDPDNGLDAEPVWCAGWTPDASRLLLCASGTRGGSDGGLVPVDTATWVQGDRLELGFPPQVLEWNPGRSRLAVGHDGEARVTVLDADLEPVATAELDAGNFPYDLAFSPDGSMLAATGERGTVAVVDTGDWALVHEPPRMHTSVGLDVEWLDDGDTVVTTGRDERVALYSVEQDLPRTSRMPATDRPGEGYAYLVPADDDEIVVHAGPGAGRRYPLDPAEWLARACGVVARDLTPTEWDRYLPGERYRPICTDLVGP